MPLTELFLDHLKVRLAYAGQALAAHGFDTLVISSGAPYTHFADDQEAPFHTVPHFRHYCPITGPHHVLKLEPGKKPLLVRYAPEDFWYEQLPLGTPFWSAGFDLIEAPTLEAVWNAVGRPARAALGIKAVSGARASTATVTTSAVNNPEKRETAPA